MASPTTVIDAVRARCGVSDCGQIMGTLSQAELASVEPEGIYEHLAIGVFTRNNKQAIRGHLS